MITKRPSSERGHANHGWLDSFHTFSFADYHDPSHMGFRALRVINEDRIAPARGFGAHPHRDMEIITYMLDGAVAHEDSTGQKGVIRPGMVQRMSAGTGVVHSEKNGSSTDPAHLLQIWIQPSRRGVSPRYEDRSFPVAAGSNTLTLLVSPDGADGSLAIHQDARLYRGLLEPGTAVSHSLAPGRHAWVQVARGTLEVGGEALGPGDAAAISDEAAITIASRTPSEFLLFDLA